MDMSAAGDHDAAGQCRSRPDERAERHLMRIRGAGAKVVTSDFVFAFSGTQHFPAGSTLDERPRKRAKTTYARLPVTQSPSEAPAAEDKAPGSRIKTTSTAHGMRVTAPLPAPSAEIEPTELAPVTNTDVSDILRSGKDLKKHSEKRIQSTATTKDLVSSEIDSGSGKLHGKRQGRRGPPERKVHSIRQGVSDEPAKSDTRNNSRQSGARRVLNTVDANCKLKRRSSSATYEPTGGAKIKPPAQCNNDFDPLSLAATPKPIVRKRRLVATADSSAIVTEDIRAKHDRHMRPVDPATKAAARMTSVVLSATSIVDTGRPSPVPSRPVKRTDVRSRVTGERTTACMPVLATTSRTASRPTSSRKVLTKLRSVPDDNLDLDLDDLITNIAALTKRGVTTA